MLKKIIIYIIFPILMLLIINEAYTKLYKLNNNQNELEKIIKVGNLPDLDTSDDIIGIDKNYNGIRDDIDTYILSLSLTELQVKRLQELAKYLQMTIIIEPSKRKDPNEFAKEKALAQFCAINAFTDKKLARQYLKNLQAYTVNTYKRARKYNDYNSSRNGSVLNLPDISECK